MSATLDNSPSIAGINNMSTDDVFVELHINNRSQPDQKVLITRGGRPGTANVRVLDPNDPDDLRIQGKMRARVDFNKGWAVQMQNPVGAGQENPHMQVTLMQPSRRMNEMMSRAFILNIEAAIAKLVENMSGDEFPQGQFEFTPMLVALKNATVAGMKDDIPGVGSRRMKGYFVTKKDGVSHYVRFGDSDLTAGEIKAIDYKCSNVIGKFQEAGIQRRPFLWPVGTEAAKALAAKGDDFDPLASIMAYCDGDNCPPGKMHQILTWKTEEFQAKRVAFNNLIARLHTGGGAASFPMQRFHVCEDTKVSARALTASESKQLTESKKKTAKSTLEKEADAKNKLRKTLVKIEYKFGPFRKFLNAPANLLVKLDALAKADKTKRCVFRLRFMNALTKFITSECSREIVLPAANQSGEKRRVQTRDIEDVITLDNLALLNRGMMGPSTTKFQFRFILPALTNDGPRAMAALEKQVWKDVSVGEDQNKIILEKNMKAAKMAAKLTNQLFKLIDNMRSRVIASTDAWATIDSTGDDAVPDSKRLTVKDKTKLTMYLIAAFKATDAVLKSGYKVRGEEAANEAKKITTRIVNELKAYQAGLPTGEKSTAASEALTLLNNGRQIQPNVEASIQKWLTAAYEGREGNSPQENKVLHEKVKMEISRLKKQAFALGTSMKNNESQTGNPYNALYATATILDNVLTSATNGSNVLNVANSPPPRAVTRTEWFDTLARDKESSDENDISAFKKAVGINDDRPESIQAADMDVLAQALNGPSPSAPPQPQAEA